MFKLEYNCSSAVHDQRSDPVSSTLSFICTLKRSSQVSCSVTVLWRAKHRKESSPHKPKDGRGACGQPRGFLGHLLVADEVVLLANLVNFLVERALRDGSHCATEAPAGQLISGTSSELLYGPKKHTDQGMMELPAISRFTCREEKLYVHEPHLTLRHTHNILTSPQGLMNELYL